MFLNILTLAVTAATLVSAAPPGHGKDAKTYDYIIVGGGTAGVALGTRLSQYLPSASILLLEAGPAAPDELRINVPGMRGSALFSEYDWNYTSIPQATLNGRTIDVNRGRVLGGSSALNYLCYDRASSAEYDALGLLASGGQADDPAARRWSWDGMLAGMIASENYTDDKSRVDPQLHGETGPIRNLFNRILPEQFDAWIPTLNGLGVPQNDASYDGDNIGVMFQLTNIDETHYTRSYAANSYLPEAGANLEVLTNSRVVKIKFDDDTDSEEAGALVATGVVLEDGTVFSASKEVILSAGSIASPQLLELSGIGQKAVVEAAGIGSILDLEGVGENYQDHLRIGNAYRLRDNYSSFDPFIYDSGSDFVAEQMQLWLDNEVSWLDYTSSAYSFLDWGHVVDPDTQAGMVELARQGVDPASPVDAQKLAWLESDPSVPQLEVIMEANYVGVNDYPGGPILTILTSIMHPMSRGSTHINTAAGADPLGSPVIDVNYLDNPYDLRAVVEGAKFARKIAEAEPMRSLWTTEYEPGTAAVPAEGDEAAWEAFAKDAVLTFFHPTSTCAMLPRDQKGVVDDELRVYGTANLRVVDASIMPLLMSGHIQTAVYGVAEIAAKMIAGQG